MPIVLFITLLLCFWAFIVWDRRRPIAPLSREALRNGWLAKPTPTWLPFTGLSAISGILAAGSWISPSHPPFTGRYSALNNFLYTSFGSMGTVYLWALIAVTSALIALITWRTSTADVPTNGSNRE